MGAVSLGRVRKVEPFSAAEMADLDPATWGSSLLLGDDGSWYKSDGVNFTDARSKKGVRTSNILYETDRFLSATVFGTGTQVQDITDLNGIKNGTLQCASGSAGRAWKTATINKIDAVGWYAFSFEVIAQNMVTGNNCGLKQFGGSATINYGEIAVTGQKILAGGNGRYCSVFRVSEVGTIIYRLGVGLGSNTANDSLTVKNIQLEKIDTKHGLVCGAYIYPGYSAINNKMRNLSLDANNKVSEYPQATFPIKQYSSIIAIGDSRTDEIGDIGYQVDQLLSATGGVCAYHAKGGWRTTHIINPTVDGDVTYTLDSIFGQTALRRTNSANGEEQKYELTEFANFNTLLLADFGVNDIFIATPPAQIMDNLKVIAEYALNLGMDVIMTDNNPAKGISDWTTERQNDLMTLNSLIESYCRERGLIFVEIYSALGDAADRDLLNSDYAAADGLHLNDAGSLLVAQRIVAAIDSVVI